MSILDNGPGNIVPPATRVASQLVNTTVRTFQQMVDSFNRGSIMFWNNPQGATPEEIAAALGTSAQEVFSLHYKLGQLIGSVRPEAIAEGLSVIGEFTYNEDGSVNVVVPEPEVVPTPEEIPVPSGDPVVDPSGV